MAFFPRHILMRTLIALALVMSLALALPVVADDLHLPDAATKADIDGSHPHLVGLRWA